MARPYSYDLRQKAVEAVLNGAKLVEVSELFGISIRTVQRWLKMWSETGDYRPKQNYQKGHSAKITDLEGFRQFVEANPGLTQKEMGVILGVSHTTVGKALKKINFTRKKKTYSYEEQNEEERQQFIKMMKEEKNEDLVYIDQSGMDNRDVYEYGWGLKGQRIYGQRPGKKRERISMMSGYHLGKLVAPFTGIGIVMSDRVMMVSFLADALILPYVLAEPHNSGGAG